MFFKTLSNRMWKIVSLDNVKTVNTSISGSGAKSNPFRYGITIEYFSNETNYIDCESQDDMNNIVEKIYQRLTAEK